MEGLISELKKCYIIKATYFLSKLIKNVCIFLLSFNKALKHDLAGGICPGNLYVAII